jgi:hypothetical protein
MPMRFRTLLFLGFTVAAAPALSGCIIETSDDASCLDNQYFGVRWEVDRPVGGTDVMFTCGETPASSVQVYTNANQWLPVLDERCDPTPGVLYNWSGFTQGGISEGTTVVRAELRSDVDNSVLSSADLTGGQMLAITRCQGVVHTFEFPVAF